MSSLYELTEEYQALLEIAEDPDADPQTLVDTMEGITGEIEDKAEGYVKVLRSIKANKQALKDEIGRLKAKYSAMENSEKRMKDLLMYAMMLTGRTKIRTPLATMAVRKASVPTLCIDDPYMENLPEEYLVQKDPEPNRAKIRKALEDGEDLGFAHLEYTSYLDIR